MNQIKCKAEHDHNNGCSSCGGYKVVFFKQHCPTCKRFGWMRPGAFTTYVGKRYKTVDGLEFVVETLRAGAPDRCVYCVTK